MREIAMERKMTRFKRLWWVIGIVVAVILTGCATPGEEHPHISEEFDWCYIFNLNQENGFLIENGIRNIVGIESDADGLINFEYEYDRKVYARALYVTVARPFEVVGDITVRFGGNVFGITPGGEGALGVVATTDLTLPAELDFARIEFRQNAYTELQIARDIIEAHAEVQGGQRITISSLEVRGIGSNPFPVSTCNGTPTPTEPPPGTPFGTSTQTPTATVTGTLSATPTPTPWECVYDFTVSDAGWVTSGDFLGTPRDGTGFHSYVNEDDLEGMHIEIYLPETITTTEILFEYTYGGAGAEYGSGFTTNTGIIYFTFASSVFPQPYLDEVTRSFNYIGILLVGEATVERVTMQGEGVSPCDPMPTATPGASSTPNATATMGPLWASCVDFTYSDYLFIAEGATWVDGEGFVQSDDIWSLGRSSFGTTAKKKIQLQFAAGQTFTGNVRLTDNGSNATDWNAVTGNTIITDFSGDAWIPTSTFFVEFDGNNVPLTLEKICWLDPNPGTLTPGPGTGTPIGTRTPLPTPMSLTPSQSRTPVGIPNPNNVITTTPGVVLTTTPLFSGTGVIVVTGTPFGTPSGGTGGTGGTGSTNTGGGAGEAGEILGFAWTIGSGLFGAGAAYLGQVTDIAGGLLSSLSNATPTYIPGLPMCVTNPMAHDLCAIWYIMHNTIFAPGTPGQLIIPFMQVTLNFVIVMIFLLFAKRIVKRSEDITHAN
jgi:hypothetical protein